MMHYELFCIFAPMKKYLLLCLKILGVIIGLLVVLLIVAAFVVNSSSFQKKALDYSTSLLAEKLQTNVKIDSVSVNFFTFDVNLMGIGVEDLQHRKMLLAEKLAVNLDLWGLLRNHIKISQADIHGVKARLYKPEDGPANYQFILDAFKSDKPKEKPAEKEVKKKKRKLVLDVSDVNIANIDVIFNADTFYLEKLNYNKSWTGSQEGKIRHLRGKMELKTKKGNQGTHVEVGELAILGKGERQQITIDSLHFVLDNHKPRKNEGKPHRGFFDVGHLDILANMELMVHHYGKDTVNFSLTKFVAADTITGFNVRNLKFRAGVNKQVAHLKDVTVQQENTVLTFDSATVQLPSKKEERKFAFQTSLIKGKTLLKDIARPFAPVLHNFTMPLELSVLFSGTDTTLVFKDIEVHTPDQRLKIDAVGGIEHLNKSKDLNIHFHVNQMQAKGTVKEEIISMFAGKKLMMKQLKNLGTIGYTGDILIIYKKESFSGLLRTAAGNLNFAFSLDENNKYLAGTANTAGIQLGKVLEMKDLGSVALKGDYKIDIDKKRTLQMRRKYGGKLPIGNVNAVVHEASYKGVKVKDLMVSIKSNGGQIEGEIQQKNKGLDWACDFSIADIDKVSTLKVKPKVKVKWNDFFTKKDKKTDDKKSDKKTDDQKSDKKSDDSNKKKKWNPFRKKSKE